MKKYIFIPVFLLQGVSFAQTINTRVSHAGLSKAVGKAAGKTVKSHADSDTRVFHAADAELSRAVGDTVDSHAPTTNVVTTNTSETGVNTGDTATTDTGDKVAAELFKAVDNAVGKTVKSHEFLKIKESFLNENRKFFKEIVSSFNNNLEKTLALVFENSNLNKDQVSYLKKHLVTIQSILNNPNLNNYLSNLIIGNTDSNEQYSDLDKQIDNINPFLNSLSGSVLGKLMASVPDFKSKISDNIKNQNSLQKYIINQLKTFVDNLLDELNKKS